MPLILQHRIYRQDLQANPDVLYVFGDNEMGIGDGGQAGEMRGEPNAFGIPTLYAPDDPWRESKFATERQNQILDDHFNLLIEVFLKRDKLVVFPSDGIGSGIADLANNAPSTFAHLQTLVAMIKEFQP
jgi:hypothetical protein